MAVPLIRQHMAEKDVAMTSGEVAGFLGVSSSAAFNVLAYMEALGIVQRVRRRKSFYFLKDIYDEERIETMLREAGAKTPGRRRVRPPGWVKRKKTPEERREEESLLEKHLATVRAIANSGEGPSALAIIGLSQPEAGETSVETREPQRAMDLLPELGIGEHEKPVMIRCEPHGTIESIPKGFRLLTQGQTRHLKENHLKKLGGYEGIDRFGDFFADISSLGSRIYGNVFYVSTSTNPWERAYKVAVDGSITLPLEFPDDRTRKAQRSKYDPIIDRFTESGHEVVEIVVEGRTPSYVTSQLKKRIEARGLNLKASTVSDVVYLEKV